MRVAEAIDVVRRRGDPTWNGEGADGRVLQASGVRQLYESARDSPSRVPMLLRASSEDITEGALS